MTQLVRGINQNSFNKLVDTVAIAVINPIQVIPVFIRIHHQIFQINHSIEQIPLLLMQVVLVSVRNKFADMGPIVVIYPIQVIAVAFLIQNQIYQLNHSTKQIPLLLVTVSLGMIRNKLADMGPIVVINPIQVIAVAFLIHHRVH